MYVHAYEYTHFMYFSTTVYCKCESVMYKYIYLLNMTLLCNSIFISLLMISNFPHTYLIFSM